MPRQRITLAAVQAAIDVHVAKGTMEKVEGGYRLVERERLTAEQAAWLDLQEAIETAGRVDRIDSEVLRALLLMWIEVASAEQLSEFALQCAG